METPASVPRASGALCIYLNCFECLFKLLEKWKNHDYNFFFPSVCYLEGYFTWLSTAVDTTQVNPVIIRKPDRYERHYYLYFCIFTPVWFSENKIIQQLLYSSNSVRLDPWCRISKWPRDSKIIIKCKYGRSFVESVCVAGWDVLLQLKLFKGLNCFVSKYLWKSQIQSGDFLSVKKKIFHVCVMKMVHW